MAKFYKNEAINLDIPVLKSETNRRLPAGYSAACMLSDGGIEMDIFDGDVLIIAIPLNGLNQTDAFNKIEHEIEGL